jgi:hypothetical protein
MDTRVDPDAKPQDDSPLARRFAALREEDRDATYPMLAPAAAIPIGHEEDAFDEQILAGLVNV